MYGQHLSQRYHDDCHHNCCKHLGDPGPVEDLLHCLHGCEVEYDRLCQNCGVHSDICAAPAPDAHGCSPKIIKHPCPRDLCEDYVQLAEYMQLDRSCLQ